MNPERIRYAEQLFEAILQEPEAETSQDHIEHARKLRGWLHDIQEVTLSLIEATYEEENHYIWRRIEE